MPAAIAEVQAAIKRVEGEAVAAIRHEAGEASAEIKHVAEAVAPKDVPWDGITERRKLDAPVDRRVSTESVAQAAFKLDQQAAADGAQQGARQQEGV